MKNRYLIVISGMPGVGKTSLADKLSRDLSTISVSKDMILEKLWESFEWDGDENKSLQYRKATYGVIYEFIRASASADASIIIESNFDNKTNSPEIIKLANKYNYKIINLHCEATPEVAFARFCKRQKDGSRHKLHPARDNFESYKKAFLEDREYRLKLSGDLIVVDMNDLSNFNYRDIVKKVRYIINE